MNLTQFKPKAIKTYCFIMLMLLGSFQSMAQEEEEEPTGNDHNQPPPIPENNIASCVNYYLCPIINQGQTIPHVNYTYTVNNAIDLYNVLSCLHQDWIDKGLNDPEGCITVTTPLTGCSDLIPSCNSTITINVTGYINLGDLDPGIFPIEVPPGVHLVGDYDISNIDPVTGKSLGTHIYFPYLYEAGKEPSIPALYWDNASYSCNMDLGFAFKLNDGAKFLNICLEGPRKDMGDIRWYTTFVDNCSPANPVLMPAREGMSGGIQVHGNACEIAHCEIFGFPLAGVMVTDMVRAWGALVNTPASCFDFPSSGADINDDGRGRFYFHHNFVHNNKSDGYGYGLYVGFNGEKSILTALACSSALPADYFWNYYRPYEEAYIENNIFFNNKHDVDCSAGLLNLYIYNNTFSMRSVRENINAHNSSRKLNGSDIENRTCNPMFGNTTCPTLPTQPVDFADIGCNRVDVWENAFYKNANNLNLVYPNTNAFIDISGYTYQFNPLETGMFINGNYFNTIEQVMGVVPNSPANKYLHWADACTEKRDGHLKFLIRDKTPYYNYLFYGHAGDATIDIGETFGTENFCETAPFSIGSNTPVAQITSSTIDPQQGGVLDESEKTIGVGETIWFSSETGFDKNRNSVATSTNNIVNLWQFCQDPTELASEFRANNSNAPIAKIFDKIGVTNVKLMSMDLTTVGTNEWRASQITTKRINVAPEPGSTYISFWIKDNYIGRQINPYATSGYTACSTCSHNFDDVGLNTLYSNNPALYNIDDTPTGFEKFARLSFDGGVTWKYIYIDDIAGDEGWEYVLVQYGDDFPVNPDASGMIEIGIHSSSNTIDAEIVRGVTFYVDDVYINTRTGSNGLINGDFEEHKPFTIGSVPLWHKQLNPNALGWAEYEWPLNAHPFIFPCHLSYYGKAESNISLSTDEVRSGLWSYAGIVPNLDKKKYQKGQNHIGVYYEPNKIYASISQQFDIQNLGYRQHQNDFLISSNPTRGNSDVTLVSNSASVSESKIEVLGAEGSLILSQAFTGQQYQFTSPLKPGIYIIKLTQNNTTSVKKLVVAN